MECRLTMEETLPLPSVPFEGVFRLHIPDETFGGFQVVTVPGKEFVIALGSKITRSGSTMVAVHYRYGDC